MPGSSGNLILDALACTTGCLSRGRITYVLIGAWALSVWGRPRATRDLDLLVMVNEKGLDDLSIRMARAGIRADEPWLKWNPMLKSVQRRFFYGDVAIDMLRPRGTHDRQALRRRCRKRLGGRYYWVIAPEDLVLQKLKVGRPRDFEDVVTVLERSGRLLNRAYLRRWAERLGIFKELKYVLSL